jgi:TonB family protein
MRACLLIGAVAAAAMAQGPVAPPPALPAVAGAEHSDEARAAGLEGVANAWAEVGRDGGVIDAGMLQGLGMGLDERALEAVRKTRFDPALTGSSPGPRIFVSIDVIFTLPEAGPHWRIAYQAHRFSDADRAADPATSAFPRLENPVLRKYARPADAACAAGAAIWLSFPIGEDGVPGEVRVVDGDRTIGEAAARAAQEWRFEPARRGGKLAAVSTDVLLKCGDPGLAQAGAPIPGGATTPPRLHRRVGTRYSEQARAAKFQGSVKVYADIGPDGFAERMRIANPIGMGLDVQALEALRQWLFTPGTRGGRPAAVAATLEVNFRLL